MAKDRKAKFFSVLASFDLFSYLVSMRLSLSVFILFGFFSFLILAFVFIIFFILVFTFCFILASCI